METFDNTIMAETANNFAKVKLTPGQLARQRKKIEKDKRRKIYDDQQIQGTNNSSIVSKRSVEKLYFPELNPELGSWFEHFVKDSTTGKRKWKRRSPAINRGYWIRMESIRGVLMRILKLNLGRKINVINLGCGFDPLPFQLLNIPKEGHDLNFIDVDYPDLVEEKLRLIDSSQEICDLIGGRQDVNGYKIFTDRYKLLGCNLNEANNYDAFIKSLEKEKTNVVNIFIAEVSLAYMKPEPANAVIEKSSKVPNSHFIILEQIMPDGPNSAFATKMLYHFEHLRSPIQCVRSYPTKMEQHARFRRMYKHVEIKNLLENWYELVPNDTKRKLAQIEEFDEWEEFIIFCQHYVVVHATNCDGESQGKVNGNVQLVYKHDSLHDDLIYEKFQVDKNVEFSHDLRFSNDGEKEELLQIKFPAVAQLNGTVYINGGLKQTRVDDTLKLDYQSASIEKMDVGCSFSEHDGDGDDGAIKSVPSPRVCHTLTQVGGQLFLVGGRTRPGDYKDEIYLFDGSRWHLVANLPSPRSRHASVEISSSELLIFGGEYSRDGDYEKDSKNNFADEASTRREKSSNFVIFNTESRQFENVQVKLAGEGEKVEKVEKFERVENLLSSTLVYDIESNIGYIYGGMSDGLIPIVNDKLYQFSLARDVEQENGTCTIHLKTVTQHVLFSRIGSQARVIKDSTCKNNQCFDHNNDHYDTLHKLLIVGGVSPRTIFTSLTNVMTFNLKSLQFESVSIPESIVTSHPPIFIGFGLVDVQHKLDHGESRECCLVVGGGAVCYSFGSCYNQIYKLEY